MSTKEINAIPHLLKIDGQTSICTRFFWYCNHLAGGMGEQATPQSYNQPSWSQKNVTFSILLIRLSIGLRCRWTDVLVAEYVYVNIVLLGCLRCKHEWLYKLAHWLTIVRQLSNYLQHQHRVTKWSSIIIVTMIQQQQTLVSMASF